MSKITERIPFRLLLMPCCGGMICHVNHRWPMYCSNCGTRVFPEIKGCASISDPEATLTYDPIKLV
jgi:hypothetical protein